MCWNTDPKPTTPRHILVKPMDFKEREKSLGHIEKKEHFTYKGKKIRLSSGLMPEENGIINLRRLGKKSGRQGLFIQQN